MHKLIGSLSVVAILTGCVQGGDKHVVSKLRSENDPIYSIAQVAPARLVGRWSQAAVITTADGNCKPGGIEISSVGKVLKLAARWCDVAGQRRLAGEMVPTGPGRFRVAGTELWVLWVDTDYRTLVLGDPSGTTLMILNKNGRLPSDRMAAVREILDFNGYRAETWHPI